MDQTVVLAERYELHDVLGRGGMADVYRATDRVLDRQVAVKVLRDSAGDETDRLRFTAEARTLAGLSHAGLVTVLDAGITAEQPFLVMELVEGTTLGRLCAARPLAPDRVRMIGAQVADAVAYAHGRGVVHRDVKPGNVLVGRDDRVKLADFGIARLLGDTVRHTRTGHAIGTAAYLAPEQVQGEELTPAVDVFSLGLVLLEALTGVRAYPGTPTESALARLSRPPHVPVELGDDWRTLLTAMTAREPADRPTAAQVAERLQPEPFATHTAERPTRSGDTAVLPTTERPGDALDARVLDRAGAAPHTSMTDRTGDALGRRPGRLAGRLAGLPGHQRGVGAAVAALLVLMVIVAIATGIGSGGGSAGGDGRDDLREQTPTRLQQPLSDLHDAVNGG
jgi:eukaryotic-like serine/threonine-protein kinase